MVGDSSEDLEEHSQQEARAIAKLAKKTIMLTLWTLSRALDQLDGKVPKKDQKWVDIEYVFAYIYSIFTYTEFMYTLSELSLNRIQSFGLLPIPRYPGEQGKIHKPPCALLAKTTNS